MVSKSFIGLYQAYDIGDPPPYKRYSYDEISRNRAHEAHHRRRDREWHDRQLAGIISDYSQRIACSACKTQMATLETYWRGEWKRFFESEQQHLGPAWTDADRKRTEPVLDADQTTWWWDPIPVERLHELFPDPEGVW
jgi:hypothetical protein